nr:MAG TPA: Repressor protein CI [Caudoviricetes sp.]
MSKISCSQRIKEALSNRGLKAIDLCKMTGISKSTMSQYLAGLYDPSQLKIELIARALKVNEAWLMGYDVPMEREKPITVTNDRLDPLDKELMDFVEGLTVEQKKFLLAQLKVMNEQDK